MPARSAIQERVRKAVEGEAGRAGLFGGLVIAGLTLVCLVLAVPLALLGLDMLCFWLCQPGIVDPRDLGVEIAAGRARRRVRGLPEPEAIEAIRPLADLGDETTRAVAERVIAGLRPEGTEVLPAAAPRGSGTELTPGEGTG